MPEHVVYRQGTYVHSTVTRVEKFIHLTVSLYRLPLIALWSFHHCIVQSSWGGWGSGGETLLVCYSGLGSFAFSFPLLPLETFMKILRPWKWLQSKLNHQSRKIGKGLETPNCLVAAYTFSLIQIQEVLVIWLKKKKTQSKPQQNPTSLDYPHIQLAILHSPKLLPFVNNFQHSFKTANGAYKLISPHWNASLFNFLCLIFLWRGNKM